MDLRLVGPEVMRWQNDAMRTTTAPAAFPSLEMKDVTAATTKNLRTMIAHSRYHIDSRNRPTRNPLVHPLPLRPQNIAQEQHPYPPHLGVATPRRVCTHPPHMVCTPSLYHTDHGTKDNQNRQPLAVCCSAFPTPMLCLTQPNHAPCFSRLSLALVIAGAVAKGASPPWDPQALRLGW